MSREITRYQSQLTARARGLSYGISLWLTAVGANALQNGELLQQEFDKTISIIKNTSFGRVVHCTKVRGSRSEWNIYIVRSLSNVEWMSKCVFLLRIFYNE